MKAMANGSLIVNGVQCAATGVESEISLDMHILVTLLAGVKESFATYTITYP